MTHYFMTMNQTPQTPPPAAQKNSQDVLLPTLMGGQTKQFGLQRGAFIFSLAFNGAIVAAILLAYLYASAHPPSLSQNADLAIPVELDKKILPAGQKMSGGGGNEGKAPPAKGVPPKPSQFQIVPPSVATQRHLLEVDPSVNTPKLNFGSGPMGSPFSNGVGLGMGSGTGIGTGHGAGVGSGSGGSCCSGVYKPGNGVSYPKAIYQPNPDYSEEGRKVKQQGDVVLEIVVGADGRVHDARVVRQLGFGLDQEAIKTVKTWRFEPGKKQGQNVDTILQVIVEFRLY